MDYCHLSHQKKMAQVVLRGSITTSFPMIYGRINVPPASPIINLQIKPMFGAQDPSLQNIFTSIVFGALADLKDPTITSEQSGITYFDSAINLLTHLLLMENLWQTQIWHH